MALLDKLPIPRDVTVLNSLLHILELISHYSRPIEIYFYFRHTLILADNEGEVIKTIIMQKCNIFGKIAFAVIKEKHGVGIIQVRAHLIGIRILGEEIT